LIFGKAHIQAWNEPLPKKRGMIRDLKNNITNLINLINFNFAAQNSDSETP
jgi:hypothetical protein